MDPNFFWTHYFTKNVFWTWNSLWTQYVLEPNFFLYRNSFWTKILLVPIFGGPNIFCTQFFKPKYLFILTWRPTRIEFLVWRFQLLNRHLDNWCKDKCHSDNRSLIFILFVVSVPNFIPIVYIFLEDFGVGCSYSCFSSSWSSSSSCSTSHSWNRGKTKSTSSLKILTEVWQYTLHGPKICWDLALFWINFLW